MSNIITLGGLISFKEKFQEEMSKTSTLLDAATLDEIETIFGEKKELKPGIYDADGNLLAEITSTQAGASYGCTIPSSWVV